MIGKVVIGKSWINKELHNVIDIIKAVYPEMVITEKGYIVLNENIIEVRE